MVKFENSGPDISQSVKLSNGPCSAEATQAVLKNEISHLSLKVSAVNGNCAEKVPVKENPWGCVNGKCTNKLPVNGMPKGNENSNNKQATKGAVKINGYSKKVAVNDAPKVNRTSDKKVSVNDALTVNGNSRKKMLIDDILRVNGNSVKKPLVNDIVTVIENSDKKVSANDIPTFNRNCNDSTVEVSVFNGNCKERGSANYSNDSNTPSESGSCSNVPVSDSLCNEKNCDCHLGFIEVVGKKKRNKNRQKNHRKKPISNLPPGMNAESMKCDKGNDKKLGEKTSSPTHLSQKPLTRNFAAIRSSEKSYSSALLNGQTGNSQLRNGVSNNFSDTQNVIKCVKLNKSSNNCDLPETRISAGHLPTDASKSSDINDILVVKCKPSDSLTKVEMTDVSAQTDVCFQNEIPQSQKVCLPSCDEEIHKSEKSSSLSDYVDDTDFVAESVDESSNAAYSESVVSNDSGRGDSEVTYDEQMPYCCEFPKDKVKNLIGKHGSYKYEIERQSGARFWVPKNVFVDEDTTIIAFTGTGAQIERAKELIKRRFRHASLRQYTAEPWMNNGPALADNFSVTLPIGTEFLGVVSCIFTPHYFWLQQWGHPDFHPLEDLERRMSNHFNTYFDVPGIANPMIGNVVALPVFVEGENLKWVRGEIINIIPESGNVIARYLDHGGEAVVPASEIRPMRHEFLSIPFFASKCCLFGVLPAGDTWSEQACAEFKRLCSSIDHPPLFKVLLRVPEGYFVNIVGYNDETNRRVDVANYLIRKGLAQFDCSMFQPPEPSNDLAR